jgi:hypothetical protein
VRAVPTDSTPEFNPQTPKTGADFFNTHVIYHQLRNETADFSSLGVKDTDSFGGSTVNRHCP